MGDTSVTNTDLDATGPSTDLSAANQPAGTTKIENGIAYDASGKSLGQAQVTKPKFDPSASIEPIQQTAPPTPTQAAAPKPKFNPNAPIEPIQTTKTPQEINDARETYLKKTGQWVDLHPTGWSKFKSWVNDGVISPDMITRAMTGYTPEQIQEALVNTVPRSENDRKIVNIPGIGNIDLYTFFGGMMGTDKSGNISEIASQQSSPLMLATMVGGRVVQALGAARNFVQATRVAKTLEADVDAADALAVSRIEEVQNATKQLESMQQNLKAAVEARDAQQGTQEAVIAARNTTSEAAANLSRARQAITEATEAKALASAKHAIALRNVSEAEKVTQGILGKAAGKLPMLPEGAVTAANIGQKGVGATFTLQAGKGVLEPRGENESIPDYIGRVATSGAYFMMGAGETGRDIKGTYHAAENGAQAFGDWYRVRESAKEATQTNEAQAQAKKDFMKAIPSGPGKSNYSDDDYAVTRPFLEDQHANVSEIKSPKHVYNATEAARQGIENIVRPQVEKYSNNSLSLGKNHDGTSVTVMQKLVAALMPSEAVNTGFLNDGLKAVDGYNLTNPTVGEADVIRRKLNSTMRSKLQQNNWAISDAITSDPQFAAMYELDAIMRDGVYGTLKENGVDGAEEARRAETSLIKVRNAAERQVKNAEVVKRGTSEVGSARKAAAWIAKKAGIAGGAAVGAATEVPGAPEVGAVAGGMVGEKAAQLLAPGDLSVEKLIQRSMKVSGAEDTRPVVTDTSALMPAEKSAPHPRENTPLHADLAGFYGESVGETPYGDLEKKFLSDVAIKKAHNVPLEKDERGLLVKINAEKIAEIKEAQKAAEKEAEEQQKLAVEQAKEQKKVAQAEEKAKVPEKVPVEEKVVLEGKGKAPKPAGRTLFGRIKAVGSHVAEATEPIQKTPAEVLPEGHTDETFLGHEFGHPAAAALEGFRGTDISSHLHPDSVRQNAVGGIGWQDKPFAFEPGFDKTYTPEQVFDNTKKWLRTYLGGAAANELLHDIPFDMKHDALRGDVRQARKVLAVHGVTGDAADALIRQEFENIKNKFLTTPGILDSINMNAKAREANLPEDLHASQGRIENFQKQIKGLADENTNRPTNGRVEQEGGAGKEGQSGVPREGTSTLAGRRGQGEAVEAGAGNRGGVNHKDVLEAIKEKHGVTDDTAGIRGGGQSFITPEGQFVHLSASTTHTDAITESGGPAPGPENGHDNRPAFINDTGAVRVHLANERAGKTLAASVPAKGVQNAEQVGAIQRLVGQELPHTGNLRIERADVNAENKNEATSEKAFPRVSDVPKMLKKIGALPPGVERSLMNYDAMRGLKEANEDQEQKGRVNAAPPTPTPELDRAAIQGGQHSTPASTYHEAAQNEGNPWVRRSADPEKSDAPTNEGRQLMVQFSSDLINGTKGEADQASQYYDKLYSGARPGYARMQDFWEIPQWQGFVSHVLPDADVYVVRDMNQAKDFLKTAKYDRVLASALDVNTSFLKDLAKSVPEQTFDVGGYVEPGTFLEHPNVKYHASVEAMTKDPYYTEKGIKYANGTDYRHYEGSDVIPRLTMSDGCLHKCAFCVVPKKLEVTPNAVVDQQAQSMGKLGAKLVYLNDKTFGQAPNYQHLSDVYTKMKEANPDFQGFVVQTTAAQMRKMPADWLQKSGIKYVELGIESYNDPILKEMHKPATEKLIDEATDKLRDNGIALIPNILIGLPGENANTYAHTLEFLKRNKDIISHANIYNLAVYKDAELGKKLTTANEGDFNENVLEKSFHADPEVHRVFAGDLYGVGQELLNGTPKPLESPERSQLSVRNGVKHINDLDENDLMFRTGQARNAIFQRAEESAKGGGFTIHPDTGHVPNEGHVIEVHPESRENLPNDITAADVSKFHDKVRPILDENPELHLGGYGKQLNLSAVGHPEGARKVGNDLDQQTAWDARNQTTVPLEGQGIKTQFPDYPLDQRLKDMGARKPDGTPTGLGTPERSELSHGLVRRTTGDEAKDKIIEDAGGVPGGVQRGIPGKIADQAYIHDPVTGTSLNLPLDQITPEAVSSYMLENRKKYAANPADRARYGLNEDGTPTAERSELAKKTESDKKERRAGVRGVAFASAPAESGFADNAISESGWDSMGDMGRGGKSWLSPEGKFTPVDRAHYEHTGNVELEDHMAAGNIRLGGLDVADSPVLVHVYQSVPTETQRAAISKMVTDQGGAIYDLSYGDKHESGEVKSANDLSKVMRDVYGKALGEENPDYSKTHPHLPDSVRNDMDPDELAFSADKPNLQKNIFKELNKIEPTVDEVANAAKAGHVLGGWWQRYMDTFKAMGEPNEAAEMEQVGPSHTEALKAFHGALSGNKSVEAANKLAWNAYHDWLEAGRPRDRAAINQIIAQNGIPKGVAAISDTHKGGKVVHEGLDTTKLFKLANSPQMRDENPEPFTGNAFLDSPVYGSSSGAKKIPSMVATTAGEGNLNRVVFDTHMKDLYRQNGLTDAKYIADSIHMRRAAREIGLQAGEGQEQVWGTVLGLKQLLGEGMTPEEAAAGLNDPVIHQIGKDYAAVILEAIETDPEFRNTLDGLHKYGFSPTSEQALAKLREIVKSGEERIGTGPVVNRELLGKTAEGLARHIGVDVDALRRERAEAPTFNFGYNDVQEATNKGALDRLSKP